MMNLPTSASQIIDENMSVGKLRNALANSLESSEQLMQNFLINMFLLNRKRRHSWPRCKLDYIQFHNFNKEIRSFYSNRQTNGEMEQEETLDIESYK